MLFKSAVSLFDLIILCQTIIYGCVTLRTLIIGTLSKTLLKEGIYHCRMPFM